MGKCNPKKTKSTKQALKLGNPFIWDLENFKFQIVFEFEHVNFQISNNSNQINF
jgi:hypothetical protein